MKNGYFPSFLIDTVTLYLVMPDKKMLLLDITNSKDVDRLCLQLNCNRETLLKCIDYSGNSIVSIESFLRNNREWLCEKEN